MNNKKEYIFSEETIKNLEELGLVLRQIHNRLVKEGKIKKVNGKWVAIENKNQGTLIK
jgi:hypothetical protein